MSNSTATLTAKIAEKTKQIEAMETQTQDTITRVLKGIDDALIQNISDLQPKLLSDLRKQLLDAQTTTLATIKTAAEAQSQIIEQMTLQIQQHSQSSLRNLILMGWWSLIILSLIGALTLAFLAIVWIRTPTSLMGEPSQVTSNWVVLTDPNWTTCQFRQGSLSPCKPILK